MSKLDSGQRRVIELIVRDRGEDGWSTVSGQLFRALKQRLPKELVVFEGTKDGGRAKLTDEGESVAHVLERWLT